MSDQAGGSGRGRRRRLPRWAWVVLIASLGLNLLVVGAVGGRYASHYWYGHGWNGHGGRFVSSLPEDRRDAIRQIWRRHRETMRPKRAKMREAWRGVIRSLGSEPVDEDELQAALEVANEAERAVRGEMVTTLREISKSLTAEERERFLARFERRYHRRHHRRRRHWGG